MRFLRDESGFTLPELLIYITVLAVIMGALSMIFALGLRTSKTSGSIEASQADVVVAFDRIDYEARCASSATLVSGGAGVTLNLPSQCPNASGTISWCVSGGSLIRYTGSACSGTAQTLINDVTSTTPFSCVVPVGDYPALNMALTANQGTTSATAWTGSDLVTLENAVLTTSSYKGCT